MIQHTPFPHPTLKGSRILLKPLDIEADIPQLFQCSHGSAEIEALWTYMPYGPFKSVNDMKRHYELICSDPKLRSYCVVNLSPSQKIGIVNFMNIEEAHRR
jgi:RimJ/RimL family protein N-acetyltransferase